MSKNQPVIVLAIALTGSLNTSLHASEPADAKELARARLDAAKEVWARLSKTAWSTGQISDKSSLDPEPWHTWSVRWLQAERALTAGKPGQLAALQAHVDRMKELEKMAVRADKAGVLRHAWDLSAARYFRIEAELWLTEAKGK